jgi:pectin methylesterase-like acyl-CoA thioesterase
MKNIARFPIRTLVLSLLLCLAVPLSAFASGEIIVSADGSGQFTTITAALNSITDASETNHYLVTVKPGTYNEAVTLPSYVDLVGSGEGVTVITSTANTNVVTLAVDNSLKNLTVESPQGSLAYGCVAMGQGGTMDHVTVLSNAYGVFVGVNVDATILDSTISATGEAISIRGSLTLESSTVYGWELRSHCYFQSREVNRLVFE